MERTDTGVLIAFEGIDGAGKTTQVDMLTDFLARAGVSVVRSKEPTDGPWGKKIRASATHGRMSLADELHAFTEDRKEHVRELIMPALRAGRTVILDRYFYSTIAYQGTRGADVVAVARQMQEIAPTPDVMFLIDVPPAIGVDRIKEGRGETPNAFEQIDGLKKAREIFRGLAAGHPEVQLIDGTEPIAAVHRRVVEELLDGALKKKHGAKAYGCDEPELCSDRASDTCLWVKMRKLARLLS
ncbi:MAG TPA: dTMP kinase [Gemmataceae bacterium]|jgi:dTMP kinase|nr:dTMP kinase [Gemmataceae bacterium]